MPGDAPVVLHAFALAIGQLGDRRILAVLAKSAAITLAVFAALGGALWWALQHYGPADGNGGFIAAIVAGVLFVIALWLLFRFVALAVLQLFGDEVVRAVEARHYPQAAATVVQLGWSDEVRVGLRSLLRSLGYNLAALPVAFILMPTAIGPALVFGLVNAVLLGRELTEMVALRHRDSGRNAPLPGIVTRTALGGIVVLLLTVPLVNFLAPVLGAAAATHLVHRGRAA